ncbi:MAG: tRNA pseudouridine(38-40) synthase TruA [Flavobacteriia bacterium]|nr:tRNA pseudouridine(38-40) synthase TruA [Flavobacteriia bacterium]OIP48514.1 MAG: tRNA pseudouridine(38-40) synthase TruA [Flavobacteriaceae bacterium CG2_30_31_66]PIV97333.1 MAG: tRNA pseudouridine(38-40) synthase TruA [Flavobacteriaceae bacterium CG17_big_fil_post_rev_8_21_14_2_50_31_13]PIX13493.1 MAG: tRNA pseudouridine(38-40) synthase TruA [Flavobacteriaceae bacterium CG_4_8_14_3_um_filter_31_8]PIY15018.1 MAG: tRNA pseudouridine(38-40) synthase TruA [Flavobacteriaceae bacterium CG_4_10_1
MRYFIEFSYNGKKYHGWQMQPEAISIQEKLNNALSTIFSQKIEVVGAGRTDTGVHALQMFAHFDIESDMKDDIAFKLNSILPDDIVIYEVFLVDNSTHARFDAVSRTYQYKIWLGRNPFLLDFSWQIHTLKPDVLKMNEAAKLLLEYEDFQCFSKVKTNVYTFNCTIFQAFWEQNGNELVFTISANRFLRNMVRAIVGTLIAVGFGKISTEDFRKIIESKNRSNAGLSVPAKGLYLINIKY